MKVGRIDKNDLYE